jgi:hypothetical protein
MVDPVHPLVGIRRGQGWDFLRLKPIYSCSGFLNEHDRRQRLCIRGLRDAPALPHIREMPMPSYRAYPVSKNRQVAIAPSVAIVCENEQDGLR